MKKIKPSQIIIQKAYELRPPGQQATAENYIQAILDYLDEEYEKDQES